MRETYTPFGTVLVWPGLPSGFFDARERVVGGVTRIAEVLVLGFVGCDLFGYLCEVGIADYVEDGIDVDVCFAIRLFNKLLHC